jgi:hypothetical protein
MAEGVYCGMREARIEALNVVHFYEGLESSPFRTGPPVGYMRGIDFYKRDMLLQQLSKMLLAYKERSGRFPNLIVPHLYSEKLNWLKLFTPLKVPESGNKLLTGNFIPEALADRIACPPIIWQSRTAMLPSNSQVLEGDYYIKANHGSGFFKRVRFPLSPERRRELESIACEWLDYPYGSGWGEWWYDTFEKKIIIEMSVAKPNPSSVILFYMFSGEVAFISVDQKSEDPDAKTRETWYDSSFNLYKDQMVGSERVEDGVITSRVKNEALQLAQIIGAQFDAARIDIIVGDNERFYLSEITFASKAGLPLSNVELDKMLGGAWHLKNFF